MPTFSVRFSQTLNSVINKLMGRSQPLTAFHLLPLLRGCGLTASMQLPVCCALFSLPRLFPSGLLKPLETAWVRWLTFSPRHLCLLTCLTTVRGRHAEGWRGKHTHSVCSSSGPRPLGMWRAGHRARPTWGSVFIFRDGAAVTCLLVGSTASA